MSRKQGYNFRVYMDVPELQETLDQIKAYDGKSRLKIEEAVSKSRLNIAKGAKQRVRVKSGALKKSISSSFNRKTVTGYVRARKPHAHLVEFGARATTVQVDKKHNINRSLLAERRPELGIKPVRALKIPIAGGIYRASAKIPARKEHPFMRPAFEDEKPNLIKRLKEAVKP